MTPSPHERRQHPANVDNTKMCPELSGESIVISGMSGLFPQSHNVKEFSDILYNKINPISSKDCRWKWKHPEASEYIGIMPDIDRFDSQFFMVHHQLAHWMDPMARKVLEQSYQAIYDAGLSPKHLNGKKVGVFIASALSDSEKTGFTDAVAKSGFGISGCSKTMYANRISYWLNTKGPSLTLDVACCGSLIALQEACSAINRGACEAAIVGATSLCLLPHSQVHANRCIRISPDDQTKSFDANANGCTRSEAISVFFLQRAKHALRAYAEIVHIKNEFTSRLSSETGQIFGFIRDSDDTAAFLKQFYSEANIPLQAVKYVEAFGSATPEADKAELEAIEKVFCDNRTDPLYVGSVISNIGYTEAASGATALTKVLLGYHNTSVASNLHCDTPRQDVAAIRDGRMCVLTEHLPFRGSFAALSCLSLTGVNSHVLLRGCTNNKDPTRYLASIPRLVTVSARQDELLGHIFEDLKSRPIDPEELALLHNIHSTNISGHLGRGYIILDNSQEQQKSISLSERIEHCDDSQRPLWFVYSGMGSQWAGMGAQLMRIPTFAAAIERCRKTLEPKGIDILHIITSPDKTIFDKILHSFVGIAAIQIALTDVLIAMGLRPDNVIGHSVGELGCAYADGCLTAEEMILSAYSRGKASSETPLIRGAMAAVGLGHTQLLKRCPPEIEIACHNGPESSTISGPAEKLKDFVATLTAEGIFAKEVPCSNIAYHSRYIADAGPHLLRYLSEIILKPRARSSRWLSTSVPQERWQEPIAQYCSAEYLTNNLLSSVYFDETSRLIPQNAVLVEVAPHGLLQAILRRSLPSACTNIPLAKRQHPDNVHFLLDAIGQLYIEGYTPHVQALYPPVEFPVSTGTPHLSHLVKWYHDESWTVSIKKDDENNIKTSSCITFSITKHDEENRYLNGNVIQDRVLYPFAATLVAVWDTLAMSIGVPRKKVSVRFEDIILYSQPILHDQKSLKLYISLNKGNGRFEVLEGDSKVATGYIFNIIKSTSPGNNITRFEKLIHTSEETYKHLSSRGFYYRDEFRSIHSVDESLSVAQLLWNNNWVTMIDGMLQLNLLRNTHNGIMQPSHIRNLSIDIRKHIQQLQDNFYIAEVDDVLDLTRCGGITINNIKLRCMMSINENKFKLIPMLSSNGSAKPFENMPSISNKNKAENYDIALQIGSLGDLDTLYWEKVPMVSASKIKVEYAAINTTDVNKTTKVKSFNELYDKYYGMDFSGLTERGERVMGIASEGSCRSAVRARSELLWPVPAHWSLEDAATVPLAYLQAYYCLCVKNVQTLGSRVLIHGGTGALGQAAISVALARGYKVFTTVADITKKRFLLKLFPQLDDDSIGNSRDASFGDMVLSATNGEGCDIIISCVKGDLKNISLNCTAHSGVTFDSAQIQTKENFEYGMFYMTKSRSYVALDFKSIFEPKNTEILKKLQWLLSDGIVRGEVRPLSRVSYSPHEAARAFRLLAASRHRGRVLLRPRDTMPPPRHSFICSSKSSHLLIWDGSSLGLQFADRLIYRGVKTLHLHCWKPTNDHQINIRLWQKMGVNVKILSGNVYNSDAISKMLDEANKCGPIEGIYIMDTAHTKNMNVSDIAHFVDQLDIASRTMCPVLKYFGVISMDCNFGLNTCISRSNNGYPATALRLPAIKNSNNVEIDYKSENPSWNRSAVDVMENALASGIPVQIARPLTIQKPSLITLIAEISDNSIGNSTLRDLGITESLPLIRSFLNDIYQVSYDDEEILNLTKDKIEEIEKNSIEFHVEDIKGLGKFFSKANVDEIYTNADFIPMNTLVHEVKAMDEGIDETQTHLFVIPALEGHYARFSTLCEHFKLPALVLQPGLDRPNETPRELALRYSKILLEKFKLKEKFCLLAYECGIFAALELAGILEDNGLTGTLYFIGDGPEEMKALLEEQLSEFRSEESLQTAVVQHMFRLMADGAAPPGSIESGVSWYERVEACVGALLGRVSHSAQYTRAVVEAAYARIGTARRYNLVPRALRSRLVLLRARRASPSTDRCSLQLYSQHPVHVRNLTAPMAHAAADLRAPAIINSYLDEDILDRFRNSNLCNTYEV